MKLKMRSSPDQKDFFFASCHAKVKLLLQTSTRVILKFSNNGNPVLRAHNAQVWDMALCSDWVNTLVQPYQEMIFNTKCLFLRLNELQVGLGCSQVWDPFFLKKCFLALMEKLTMQVSSIHKTKTAKITHLLRKRGGGGNHLHKVSLSPSYKGHTIHFQNAELSPLVPCASGKVFSSSRDNCALLELRMHRLWGDRSEKEEAPIAIAKRHKFRFNLSRAKEKNPVATWLASYWIK